jgi:heterodisulfide reductase subunit A-like polyferredoxin
MDAYGFCHTVQFNPIETSRKGIFAVGPFREPKDIPESVVEASGAAAAVAGILSPARFTQTHEISFPPERDIRGEAPRVGVFVCHCGSNIAGFLDVAAVAEHARSLPHVALAETNLYTCSQDSIKHISEVVAEKGLNRVVVASCTPLTHQPLFQDSLRAAGLNPYLFEMANIRNHCSWVHSDDRPAATEKAMDLVRMAVARAALLAPQQTVDLPVQQQALVVGGGVAGMSAALSLAEQGFPVDLIERQSALGGNLRQVHTQSNGRSPQATLRELVGRIERNDLVTVHLASRVVKTSGFTGNFASVIRSDGGVETELKHGVTILATGGREYRGPEYGYGQHPRIFTQQELEAALPDLPAVRSVVMIQCVGPAEQFCSRICCNVALKNAVTLKERHPEAQIVIFYRDIRTYGFGERLYTRARRAGVLFVRYDDAHRPEVRIDGDTLEVRGVEPVLGRSLALRPDLLVLSMPVVPAADSAEMAALFKVPVDADGFFLEAHVKLRPVDFNTDGVFMAGMAHYPKLMEETMIQAQAAAARAARVLSRETMVAGGRIAVVDQSLCTGCLTCVRACPFGVPRIQPDLVGVGGILGAAKIEAAICQGCGICAAECPARAIQLMHYTDEQMAAKVRALTARPAFVPLGEVMEVSA